MRQRHKHLGRGGTAQLVELAVGASHDASDTTGPIRLGTMQGGIVMPLRAGRSSTVHGVVSRGATAIRPNTVYELLATYTRE